MSDRALSVGSATSGIFRRIVEIPIYDIITIAMSKLSFKSFCIEYYAKHAGITGAAAYALFDKSGLIKALDDDYEDLHGLGWEALMPIFDQYLGRNKA